jgi:(2Fe-2S) ferredoxin
VIGVCHLFVCTNQIASGKPACGRRGGAAFMAAVQHELITRGVTARVTSCGCLGPCFDGPNAVVYPDGIWYGNLSEADAHAVVDHLEHGTIYDAKRSDPPGDP